MSDKLQNLDAKKLKALLARLVTMGASDIDTDQAYATLVDDNDAEEQDIELELVYSGRPSTVLIKASVLHNNAPVFALSSDNAEIVRELTAAV